MPKQTFTGLVTSSGKMDKTVKVRVSRLVYDKNVKKDVVHSRNYLVHDEINKCREGDVVRIQHLRPLSARKRFAVVQLMTSESSKLVEYKDVMARQVEQAEQAKMKELNSFRNKDPTVSELREYRKLQLDEARHAFHGQSADKNRTARLEYIKEKYGLGEWPPSKRIVELDVTELKRELESLELKACKAIFSTRATRILQDDPAKADEILMSLDRDNVHKSKSIKRNLLMKHFFKELTDAV